MSFMDGQNEARRFLDSPESPFMLTGEQLGQEAVRAQAGEKPLIAPTTDTEESSTTPGEELG